MNTRALSQAEQTLKPEMPNIIEALYFQKKVAQASEIIIPYALRSIATVSCCHCLLLPERFDERMSSMILSFTASK